MSRTKIRARMSHKLSRHTMLFAACSALCCFPFPMQMNSTAGLPAQQKLTELFRTVTDTQSPGLASLVRKDGNTLLVQGYGARDLRSKAKIDARTNFRLPSVTKQFNAMSITL